MKAVFIAYDQAHHEKVVAILDHLSCRGFTSFGEVQGRGSDNGDPHYGTHAWPSLACAMIAMVADEKAPRLLAQLRALDESRPKLGLRAFVWNVEDSI